MDIGQPSCSCFGSLVKMRHGRILILVGFLLPSLLLALCNGEEVATHEQDFVDESTELADLIQFKMDATWQEYKEAYGKEYGSQEAEQKHEKQFHERKQRIHEQNVELAKNKESFRLGFSPLTDLTHSERQQLNGFRRNAAKMQQLMADRETKMSTFSTEGIQLANLPESLDWRKGNGSRKLVTPVKNQGRCGSCWAFSTVGILESAHSKATGALIRLSEQNLLDCDQQEYGCWGGWPSLAMEFAIGEGGLNWELLYPYKGSQENCSFNVHKAIGGAKVRGYGRVPEGDEQALMAALHTHGPISVAIYASEIFMDYAGGILDDPSCAEIDYLNHAVMLVGYGTDAKFGDYWIVKNSWSTKWGDKGYIRMSRNKNNQCGIASEAIYATF